MHSIEQALNTPEIDRVVVSTDDDEITDVARDAGAEIIRRPGAISDDQATSECALIHVLDSLRDTESYEPELVVFLQATSPLRRPQDITTALMTLRSTNADSILSVAPSHRFLWRIEDGQPRAVNYDYKQRSRRQDRPDEYVENGSIYIFKPWVLRELNNRIGGKIALYEMDEWSAIDIDGPTDIQLCELIIQYLTATDYFDYRKNLVGRTTL